MTQHTLGPWHAPHNDSPFWNQDGHVPIVAPDGGRVVCIAERAIPERHANARLIAASPEGLELARLVRRYFAGAGPAPTQGELVELAHCIIAKATD